MTLHPVIVHFPIVLFILFSVLELTNLYLKNQNYNKLNYFILLTGVVFAVIAVLTGNMDAAEIGINSGEIYEAVENHESYATFTLFIFSIIFLLKTANTKLKKKPWHRNIVIFLIILGCAAIFMTGNTGGKLVYKYGIGTKLFINEAE